MHCEGYCDNCAYAVTIGHLMSTPTHVPGKECFERTLDKEMYYSNGKLYFKVKDKSKRMISVYNLTLMFGEDNANAIYEAEQKKPGNGYDVLYDLMLYSESKEKINDKSN